MSRLLSEIPHAPNTKHYTTSFSAGDVERRQPTDRVLPVGKWAAAQSAIKADLAYLDRTINCREASERELDSLL
ncbi:hypothetical protein Csa_011158, partial [Cucumis sativus]